MADESKSGGFLGAVAALFQQWQIVVAAIAAVTALWFGFDDQRRKQLEINRTAVGVAKERRADFIADPHNTLVELRATFPEHAFCAALGFYVAEAGRLAGSEGGMRQVKQVGDAIGAQIERLAAQGGSSLEELQSLAIAAAGAGGAASDCPRLRPGLAPWSRATTWQDCRLLLATFAQAQCQAEATRIALAMPLEPGPTPPEQVTAPAPPTNGAHPGPTSTPPAAEPEPAASRARGPGEACGAAPPTVFIQFVSEANRSEAEAVRAGLAAAGWPVAEGLDLEAGGRTSGDVRFYWPEQADCAAQLAAALGDVTGAPFSVISLAGRYRNLPRGRVEAWLPAS